MKKLSKLKLNVLREQDLAEKQMNSLRGGYTLCSCSCYWEGNGGSSSATNRSSNYNSGYSSEQGDNCYWEDDSGYGNWCYGEYPPYE